MTIKEINKEIQEAAKADGFKFLNKYLSLETELLNHLTNYEGLQTEIYLHHDPNELERIKYAAIFSDFVSLYMGNSSSKDSHLSWFDEQHQFYRERQITIPLSLKAEILPLERGVTPGYLYHRTEDIQKQLQDFSSLFSAEKSILRPVRALMVIAWTAQKG